MESPWRDFFSLILGNYQDVQTLKKESQILSSFENYKPLFSLKNKTGWLTFSI